LPQYLHTVETWSQNPLRGFFSATENLKARRTQPHHATEATGAKAAFGPANGRIQGDAELTAK